MSTRLVDAVILDLGNVLVFHANALHWEFLRPRLPALARFRGMVLSHEVGAVKPEPAISLRAASVAGVPPGRAAFFDDVPAYVDAANALGFHGHVFTDVTQFEEQLRALG